MQDSKFVETPEQERARKDAYIFGTKETFKYGEIGYLTFEDYFKYASFTGLLSLNNLHIFYQYYKAYKKENKLNEDTEEFLEQVKNAHLIEIINSPLGDDWGLKEAYLIILNKVIYVEEDNLTLYDELHEEIMGELPRYTGDGEYVPLLDDKGIPISEPKMKEMTILKILTDKDLFMEVRKKIMDMNVIKEDKITTNPEINEFLEMSKEVKKNDSDEGLADILTSIVVATGHDYPVVANWNLHQVYGTFQRIATFKEYEASLLFSTVAPDVKVPNWNKHINLFEEEKTATKKSELLKGMKGVVK